MERVHVTFTAAEIAEARARLIAEFDAEQKRAEAERPADRERLLAVADLVAAVDLQVPIVSETSQPYAMRVRAIIAQAAMTIRTVVEKMK